MHSLEDVMAAWELNLFIKFVYFIDELLACYM